MARNAATVYIKMITADHSRFADTDRNPARIKVVHTVVIEGRVLPERRHVTVPPTEIITLDDPRGFQVEFDIRVKDGHVRVECKMPKLTNKYLHMSTIRAYEYVTALVDMIAFSKGWALDVIIDDLVVDDERRPIALSETSVASLCTVFSDDKEFREISELVVKDLNLKFALRDLISSLSTLNYSAIAGARTVEAIRGMIAPENFTESKAWEIMRDKLQIDRSYLQFITDSSRKPRHGIRGETLGQEQMEVTHRAWSVMNRYLEFLKRGGCNPLPEDEFPPLAE